MSKILDHILESHPEETFMKADLLDEAIIGLDESTMRLIYSQAKVIEILMKEGDGEMNYEEAMEHYFFNIQAAYMGEKTPIWNNDLEWQDL
jgi:hypothetical protein